MAATLKAMWITRSTANKSSSSHSAPASPGAHQPVKAWGIFQKRSGDDSTYEMSIDDWMYLMDEDTLINRTSMSKLGVEVGQVTLFFRRQSAGASQ